MIQSSFKKLKVWQISFDLSFDLYNLTKKFPKDELYAITSQIRRASVSVPSNIAEGSQRSTDREFARFILISKGSLAELETQLMLSARLNYISTDTLNNFLIKIEPLQKMLHSFYLKLIANS